MRQTELTLSVEDRSTIEGVHSKGLHRHRPPAETALRAGVPLCRGYGAGRAERDH